MMSENVKQRAAVFLLLVLFLFAVPAVSLGAESGSFSGAGVRDSGGAASDEAPPSYAFPAGTTVESLALQLAPQGPDEILRVVRPDGSVRTEGPIETGDLVEVLGPGGQVLSCVTALVEAGPQSSSPPASSQEGSSSAPAGQPEEDGSAVFPAGTTVESLQDELDADGGGRTLKVKSHAGKMRGSGYICTGDTVSVFGADGDVLSETKAVVPGDLTRCGLPTDEACDLLYSHLIRRSELSGDLLDAADLDRNGSVDPSDLLRLKKAAAQFN